MIQAFAASTLPGLGLDQGVSADPGPPAVVDKSPPQGNRRRLHEQPGRLRSTRHQPACGSLRSRDEPAVTNHPEAIAMAGLSNLAVEPW